MRPSLTPFALFLTAVDAIAITSSATQVQGFDISNWQSTFDFEAAYKSGARFCIIKVRPSPVLPTQHD